MVAANVRNNRIIHFVAADSDRAGINNTAERNNRHLGGAAADVNNHAAGWLRHRQSGADCRRHRFFDQANFDGSRRSADS